MDRRLVARAGGAARSLGAGVGGTRSHEPRAQPAPECSFGPDGQSKGLAAGHGRPRVAARAKPHRNSAGPGRFVVAAALKDRFEN
jgi:hypothetical protein